MSELTIRRVDESEFLSLSKSCANVFNKGDFVALNAGKVKDVHYLVIERGHSPRFVIAFGVRDREALCPFSAPFSYPESLKKGASVERYMEAGELIGSYLESAGVEYARMTLPPAFYDEEAVATWHNVLFNLGWKPSVVDLNFAMDLTDLKGKYEAHLDRAARKNLAIAQKSGLTVSKCVTDEERHAAYAAIKANRESKGYPLRMTEEQVFATIQIVPASMFLVRDEDEVVAAALVYDVSDRCAQVVYWGDVPGHAHKKVINFLAHELVEIYIERGFDVLDIGPSTEHGLPNVGLCDFKDGIGCTRTAKLTFEKTFPTRSDKRGV